ncbi:MAG: type II toxin-antitoxin system death-on-curing family toxin [Lactobacillaceae bacterium]|jgi:death-on-curing protein|nr:type II toxin-antitoxin system death-on-curing family toxin [Lactobacillaceae bacterium]
MVKIPTEKQIAEANFRLIDRYSPNEEKAIKDSNALNMIVNLVDQHVFGKELYPELFDKSTILFILLVLKHIFANGNKRTATFILISMLRNNGYDFRTNLHDLKDLSVYVATHGNNKKTFEYVKSYIETNAVPFE